MIAKHLQVLSGGKHENYKLSGQSNVSDGVHRLFMTEFYTYVGCD